MPECEECGSHVTHAYARAFGNNDGEVHGCLECKPNYEAMNAASEYGGRTL